MLERVQEVDRSGVSAHWFSTHTVPAGEADWSRIECLRRAWVKRFARRWGKSAAAIVWKKDDHQSGTPHLHEIILWLVEPPDLLVYRAWNDVAWAEVVASENPAHVRTGCNVQRVRTWRGVASYAAHYLGHEINESHEETGRIWGIYNRKLLPRSVKKEVVGAAVGKSVRRCFRKLRASKRVRTFVRFGKGERWRELRPYLFVSSYTGEREWVTVEDQLSLCRHIERTGAGRLQIRCRRPRCCTTVPVQIWQEVHETNVKKTRIEPGEIEYHAYTSGRHFIESAEALRCVAFFKGEAARADALAEIPF